MELLGILDWFRESIMSKDTAYSNEYSIRNREWA